jgi:uroporphyrin-III C-methyltransferase
VVPGVTAALAAAAELGVSLTRRGVSRNVVFATPRVGAGEAASDWTAALAAADTGAIYMGAGEAAGIAAALTARGKPASLPVVAVENASLPGSRRWVTTLGDLPRLADEAFAGPVVLILGETVAAVAADPDRVRTEFLEAAEAHLLRAAM